MSDEKSSRRRRDLAMMRNSQRWPLWPILPLKRYDGVRSMEYGFLHADAGSRVIKRDVAEEALTIDELPHETFASFEAIVDAGWTVD